MFLLYVSKSLGRCWKYQLRLYAVFQMKTHLHRYSVQQYKGVPWVNAAAAAGNLARSTLSYHSLVQDGEANVTRIRGKR